MIDEPPRTASGYRQYPEDTVSTLRFIKRAKDLGFSLGEVSEMISLRLDSEARANEVKTRAEAKIASIEAKLSDLQKMRVALLQLVQSCDGGASTAACPILLALDGDEA